MLDLIDYLLVGGAALVAGFVNALAGGGTLLSFPVLLALGLPPVTANVSNTLALCPGYFGGTFAQREDLRGQARRLWHFLPIAVVGGLGGGGLLLLGDDATFRVLVPYLILGASLLLAVQEPLKRKLFYRPVDEPVLAETSPPAHKPAEHLGWALIPMFLAAVYGGYFGAGLSVIVLATLGLVVHDTLSRLNAVKQLFGGVVNVTAAVFFVAAAEPNWPVVAVMAAGALAGGAIGGRFARRVSARLLRTVVVVVGLVVGLAYLWRG